MKCKKKKKKLLVELASEPEGMGIRGQGSLHCALMSSFCLLGDETEAGWVMKAAQGASRTLSPSSAKFYSMESIRGMKTNETYMAKLICSCVCPPTLIYPMYLYLFPIYSSLSPIYLCLPHLLPSTTHLPLSIPSTSIYSPFILVYPIYLCLPHSATHLPPFTSVYQVYCLLSSHFTGVYILSIPIYLCLPVNPTVPPSINPIPPSTPVYPLSTSISPLSTLYTPASSSCLTLSTQSASFLSTLCTPFLP